jgi:hypothetical protein
MGAISGGILLRGCLQEMADFPHREEKNLPRHSQLRLGPASAKRRAGNSVGSDVLQSEDAGEI